MNRIKESQLFILLFITLFYSCKSNTGSDSSSDTINISSTNISESTNSPAISYNVFMNDSSNKSHGFGYNILLNNTPYIHQSAIPAVGGNHFFQTEEQAKTVASFVSYKIQNNIMPPTITQHELDSLGISIK